MWTVAAHLHRCCHTSERARREAGGLSTLNVESTDGVRESNIGEGIGLQCRLIAAILDADLFEPPLPSVDRPAHSEHIHSEDRDEARTAQHPPRMPGACLRVWVPECMPLNLL